MDEAKTSNLVCITDRKIASKNYLDEAGQFRFDAFYMLKRTRQVALLVSNQGSTFPIRNQAKLCLENINRVMHGLNIDTDWSDGKKEEVENLLLRCARFLFLLNIEMAEEGLVYTSDLIAHLLQFVDPQGSEKL